MMSNVRFEASPLAIFLSLLFLKSTTLFAAQITVFAAASLTEALKDIAASYQKQSGDKVVFNFGASSTLARQIQEGAPTDIFFSADEAKMDELQKLGLLAATTRRSLLGNTLVIVVSTQTESKVHSPQDLASNEVRRVALADTTAVPAGIYAKAWLRKVHLWKAVEPKIVPTENVRAALSAVESGNVEAGIVYKTDAAISKKVKAIYEVPIGDGPDISYPVALVQGSEQKEYAMRFLNYLDSEGAASIFEKYGFVVRE